MMQITVDVASLTQEQREHVSGFILTYPKKSTNIGALTVSVDTSQAAAAIKELKDAAGKTDAYLEGIENRMRTGYSKESPPVDINSGEISHADNPATGLPEARDAFGDPVAQAFGGNTSPLPQGATAAPCTAVAAQSLTAPVVVPVTTASPPVNVPLPPVLNTVPVVPAPTAPATPSSNPANGVELDKDGLPYDARIHSGGKSKNADGRWKKRKQVDPAVVAQVEAELRQVLGAPGPNVVAPAAIPGSISPPIMNAPSPGAVSAPAPIASTANPTDIYMGLVGRASAAMSAGKLTEPEVTQICQLNGVPGLPMLLVRPDLIATVAQQIDDIITSRG